MDKIQGWKFPIDVDPATGRIRMVENNDAVRQDIELILGTQRRERPLRPSFGADTQQFMFQTVDVMLVDSMANSLSSSISRWEKHISSMTVNISEQPSEQETVLVEIDYQTDIVPMLEHMEKSLSEEGLK